MAYATIGDIFSRYAPIYTMVGTGRSDVTSLEVSSIFIADAESFVNAHLGRRYTVPVAVEPIVTMITADIAISNMMFEKLGELPNFMQPRYERAMMMLEKLSDGSLVLTSSSTSIVTTGDNFAWSTNIDYHSIFSPVLDELDQAADLDQIRADKDERVNDYSYTSS